MEGTISVNKAALPPYLDLLPNGSFLEPTSADGRTWRRFSTELEVRITKVVTSVLVVFDRVDESARAPVESLFVFLLVAVAKSQRLSQVNEDLFIVMVTPVQLLPTQVA